jgi:hypothetical protein
MGSYWSTPLQNPEEKKGAEAVKKKAKDALDHAIKAAGPDGPMPDEGVRITGQAKTLLIVRPLHRAIHCVGSLVAQ